MKWLALVTGLAVALAVALTSGCAAINYTMACLADDEFVRAECESSGGESQEERARRWEAERRVMREHDADMQARQEYRAALAPCRAGDARACFVTALYEDRHGAPSTQVEQRYRFACVEGIGRACFMAGTHARARVGADAIAARELALASFTHGCALRDGESCRAGIELDPTRTDLLDTACAEHYRWACEMRAR